MRMEKPPIHGATSDAKPTTTFVHANSSAFREVVQRLTGPSETTFSAPKEGDATKVVPNVKRTTSKLHERRKYMKPKLEIMKPTFQYKSASSPGSKNSSFPPSPGSGSSSVLPSPTTPSTIFSKLTLLVEDEKKEDSVVPELNTEEEEKAIRERRFYLHPSPRSKQGFSEPELLTLFPLASPNASNNV
ncbi:PREDICTED: VQ motif-containing protein 31-like [Lupinus angustifolius]|nr:PREDICTED: VQ motif-containing protein 31-like [Lupinus angustifolius]